MIIVGHKTRTEAVEGGGSKLLDCEACGAPRKHREHRVLHAATLFFVPVANVTEQRVWCCEGCGRRVSDGPMRAPSRQGDTALGRALSAVDAIRQELVGSAPVPKKPAPEEDVRPPLDRKPKKRTL